MAKSMSHTASRASILAGRTKGKKSVGSTVPRNRNNSDLRGFYSDSMGLYSDLMGFYSDLMGFHGML